MRTNSGGLAHTAGVAKSTVMRFGREQSPFTVGAQWRVTYCRGSFTISQREDYREPEPVVAPDWWSLPTGLVKRERHSRFDIGMRRALAYRFVEECIGGHIALAPWQRGEVWTEGQQVALLDSMMRGISIGALTMWHRPRSESLEGARPLPGCSEPEHGYMSAQLIVDGQQRATTLVRAALGHIDHWRWNGHEWTTGKGFLTPRLAILGGTNIPLDERREWGHLMFDHPDKEQSRIAFNDHDRVSHTDIDLMVLGGTAAEMIETYSRLATHGSPHSPEDLAVMERWLAAHTNPLTKAYRDLGVPNGDDHG